MCSNEHNTNHIGDNQTTQERTMITLENIFPRTDRPPRGGLRALKSYWRRRFFRIMRQKKRDDFDWMVLCYQLLLNDSCTTAAAASSNGA